MMSFSELNQLVDKINEVKKVKHFFNTAAMNYRKGVRSDQVEIKEQEISIASVINHIKNMRKQVHHQLQDKINVLRENVSDDPLSTLDFKRKHDGRILTMYIYRLIDESGYIGYILDDKTSDIKRISHSKKLWISRDVEELEYHFYDYERRVNGYPL